MIFLITLLIIIFVGFIIQLNILSDDKGQSVLATCIILFVVTAFSVVMWQEGYKWGQVDIINGHAPQYRLLTKPDKDTEWEMIK